MYSPVSTRFLAAVAGGFSYKVTADVYRAGAKLNTAPLKIIDGEMTASVDDVVRRTTDIVFADDTGGLVPVGITDPLMPNGPEIRVKAGVVFSDGTEELLPVGRFRISQSRSEFGRVKCRGFDLAITLATPLTQPYPFDAGLPVESVIVGIASRKNPALVINPIQTNELTVAGICDFGDTPIEFIRKLAYSAGCDAYMDPNGVLVIAPLVSVASKTATARFSDNGEPGTTDAVFWNEGRELNSDGVPSVVVVEANHSALTTPLRVVVRDTGKNSPTNADGPYGEVVSSVSSDKVSVQTQCMTLGRAELERKSWAEAYDWSCPPNSALAEGDTASITRGPLRLSNKHAIITELTLPYTPTEMRIRAVDRRTLDAVAVQD